MSGEQNTSFETLPVVTATSGGRLDGAVNPIEGDFNCSGIVAGIQDEGSSRMGSLKHARLAFLTATLVVSLMLLVWHFQPTKRSAKPSVSTTPSPGSATWSSSAMDTTRNSSESAPTTVYAHNLMLRKGPNFRIYVRWLRGQMIRTHPNVNPSFDDPESFLLEVKTGVIRANIGDISNFLNASAVARAPVKNITLSGDGTQVKLRGTLHKIISLFGFNLRLDMI